MIAKKDISTVVKALVPTLIIAVGAGFTIPFISLFFSNVHGLSTSQFATLNLVAAILVATGSLMVPKIKDVANLVYGILKYKDMIREFYGNEIVRSSSNVIPFIKR